ncbi:rRNA maturation RNase YbeY [Candidatus Woesebacteria bacterium]|nr:rRNA maturation RNase YbeY [Candidatus Woesebacteria bacterium]
MNKIFVTNESNYPFNSSELKKRLKTFLLKKDLHNSAVEIALVDESEMKRLGKTYLKEKDASVHNVLSFPTAEARKKFVPPPDGVRRLGEIVICYPKALEEAEGEGKDIEDKIYELAEHGTLHLLGKHHG